MSPSNAGGADMAPDRHFLSVTLSEEELALVWAPPRFLRELAEDKGRVDTEFEPAPEPASASKSLGPAPSAPVFSKPSSPKSRRSSSKNMSPALAWRCQRSLPV